MEVMKIFKNLDKEVRRMAIEFLQDIPDNGVHLLLTWITLQSYLQVLAADEDSDFLTSCLGSDRSRDFIKAYLLRQLFTGKITTMRNCVPISPRTTQLDTIIAALWLLLDGATVETLDRGAIKQCLAELQGVHYGVYQYPPDDDFADRAYENFAFLLATVLERQLIYMERKTCLALLDFYRKWMDEQIDWDTAIHVLPNWHLCFVWTEAFPRRRVIISSSLFQIFAENTPIQGIRLAMRTKVCLLDLLCKSGNVPELDANQSKRIDMAYLMGL
eukprot:scaffold6270_cov162-Amphora_coffeaeformis.AAC.3